MKNLILLSLFLFPHLAFAWGGRGHNAICQSAVFLVKEKGLKKFLQDRPHVMGYLCNVPDVDWKALSTDVKKTGNPTHFIDPEVLGLKPADVPLDFAVLLKNYIGKPNKYKNDGSTLESIPQTMGTNWWRADQFVRRTASLKKDFETAKPPENFKEAQDENSLYNKTVFSMMVNMGLMGHFTGDNAQPYHVTADHDGYKTGHGGIHSYYEEACVDEFDGDLQNRILVTARKMKNRDFLKGKTVLERMRNLAILSYNEIPEIIKLDPIVHLGNDMTPATRKPQKVGYEVFNKLIITDMARGALLTANLWDEAYIRAGRPDLNEYRSFKYPYRVDFIPPDYIPSNSTK